jgi:hypothetical protein
MVVVKKRNFSLRMVSGAVMNTGKNVRNNEKEQLK